MAKPEGDLPKTCALGVLLHGGSPLEQVKVIRAGGSNLSSKALAERNQVAQWLRWTPTPAARRRLCLLAFTGLRRVAPALPSPKAHRAGRRGAETWGGEDVGGPGTGQGGDGWISSRGLMCLNTRTWRGKPINVTFAHSLLTRAGPNPLSGTEPRTES